MKLPLKNIVWKEGKFYVRQWLNAEVPGFGDTKKWGTTNFKEALDLYFVNMPFKDALTIEHVESKLLWVHSIQILSSLDY